MPLLFALIFCVTTYPFYQKFVKFCFGRKIVAAFLYTTVVFVAVVALIVFMFMLLLGEVFNLKDIALNQFATYAEDWFNPEEWNKFILDNVDKVKEISRKIPFVNEETMTNLIQGTLQEITTLIKNFSTQLVVFVKDSIGRVGALIVGFIYFYLATLFFLIDGDRALSRLLYLMPLRNAHIREVEHRFRALFKSWIIGNLAIMVVQGILGGIGFAIAGIPSPTIWGVIMTFLSLVPFVGTTIIWLPAAVFLLLSGNYFAGIFLIVWGTVIVGTSDNFIRPMVLKGGAHLSMLILFFSILGGLQAFGFKGLILGPIIVVFLDTILHIYSLEFEPLLKKLNK